MSKIKIRKIKVATHKRQIIQKFSIDVGLCRTKTRAKIRKLIQIKTTMNIEDR